MGKTHSVNSDTQSVLEASALLDITEFHLFNLAYFRWYGHYSSPHGMEQHFANYMFCAIVPLWVRHFTREILHQANIGRLNGLDYDIHVPRPSAAVIRRGRRLVGLLFALCLLLLLSSYFYEDLLLVLKNCYFPPCY
jgi:hypothetical protein